MDEIEAAVTRHTHDSLQAMAQQAEGERRSSAGRRWLVRFALHRPALRAWAMYDWANSAVWTSVVAAIFPVYFYTVAGAGLPAGAATARFALATTLGMVLTALLTPLLGAVADVGAAARRCSPDFMAAGAVATTGLLFVGRGNWLGALALFVVIELGLSGACVFYDSCSRTSRGGKRSIPYQRPRTRWGTSAAVCCWR